MAQCKGFTLKGQPCKIRVANGDYCHYHDPQSSHKPSHKQKPDPKTASNIYTLSFKPQEKVPRNESIYMYTFNHMAVKHPRRENWILVGGKPFNPKNHILVKIGRTSQKVSTRLEQWSLQCKHDIRLLDHLLVLNISPSSLHSLFSSLTISDTPRLTPSRIVTTMGTKYKLKDNDWKAYNEINQSFECGFGSAAAEKAIHQALRQKYGTVLVDCERCRENGKGAHKEWFILPRDRVAKVFILVDEICGRYKTETRPISTKINK